MIYNEVKYRSYITTMKIFSTDLKENASIVNIAEICIFGLLKTEWFNNLIRNVTEYYTNVIYHYLSILLIFFNKQ